MDIKIKHLTTGEGVINRLLNQIRKKMNQIMNFTANRSRSYLEIIIWRAHK